MKTNVSKRIIILIICVVAILFVGCSKSGISMNYVKTPDKIYLTGDLHRQEIIELNKKYEETKDYNEKQKILQEIAQLEVRSTVMIDDKVFINKFLNYIHNSKGKDENIILDRSSKDYYSMQFVYNGLKTMDENKLKEGYMITNINIYNGYALFPKYDKTSNSNITFISVKLSDSMMNYLKDYYKSKAR